MKWCATSARPGRQITAMHHIDDAVEKMREGTITLTLYDSSSAPPPIPC